MAIWPQRRLATAWLEYEPPLDEREFLDAAMPTKTWHSGPQTGPTVQRFLLATFTAGIADHRHAGLGGGGVDDDSSVYTRGELLLPNDEGRWRLGRSRL